MKIITITRTRNEQRNIVQFCNGYSQIADLILVADGNSTDNTVELAQSFPRVKVRKFEETVKLASGLTRNPDWKHINFLIEWANEERADWIIFQDTDSHPNFLMKEDGAKLFNNANPFILITEIFFWGRDQYFPRMAQPGQEGVWQPSLWAWKADQQLRAFGAMPHFQFCHVDQPDVAVDFDKVVNTRYFPPYCRLHRNWETPEITQAHVDYYRHSGLIPAMLHPLDMGGKLLPIEPWMVD
jgi:glycosyltransferase involved in cell wall biosynthesis